MSGRNFGHPVAPEVDRARRGVCHGCLYSAETLPPYDPRMADLFDDYRLGSAWDEMIDAGGAARPSYQALYESIQKSGSQELRAGVDTLARAYLNQGVTFDVGGEE